MRVFVLAGEASGDRLGAALMQGLKTLRPDVTFAGIGGPGMIAQGLSSLFPMAELSVMGLAEVLPRYRHLKRRLEQTVAKVLEMRPDVLITIDSPDFSLRVAARVRAQAPIRAVHYVAPTVWAWRAGRAEKIARTVDQVLALLPFEPPYLEAAGVRCDFVGHPVVAEPVPDDAEIAAFRAAHDLGEAPILLVLPGSRSGEVSRLTPVFGAALTRLLAARPEWRVVVPAAPGVAGFVGEKVAAWPGNPLVLDPSGVSDADAATRKRVAFRAADLALAASGTVSLELAAAETPMVVAYDMNWLTWQIASRMVRLDTVTLVNLVSGRNVVPEFLGPACKADAIADALLALAQDPQQQEAQHAAMRETMQALGQGDEAPGLRAARAVLSALPT
ncbi:MAG: lipid-A-disaccharide synthase [Pseudomonadota bacterium]